MEVRVDWYFAVVHGEPNNAVRRSNFLVEVLGKFNNVSAIKVTECTTVHGDDVFNGAEVGSANEWEDFEQARSS